MLRWLLALLLIPFVDAVLLGAIVVYVDVIGLVGMVALVVLTGLVGLLLVRAEGRRTIGKIQRSLEAGRPPTNELLDGALLIAAGAFLLTPGLVTDFVGFLLVIPLTRIPIRMAIKRYVVVPYVDGKTDGFATGAVWTAGFPGEEHASAAAGGGTVDLGEGEYRVDVDDARPTDRVDDRPGAADDRSSEGSGPADDRPGAGSNPTDGRPGAGSDPADDGDDRDAVGR